MSTKTTFRHCSVGGDTLPDDFFCPPEGLNGKVVKDVWTSFGESTFNAGTIYHFHRENKGEVWLRIA